MGILLEEFQICDGSRISVWNHITTRRPQPMRKVEEVLQLRFELGLGPASNRTQFGMGLSTVHDYLDRAAAWDLGMRSRSRKYSQADSRA